MKPLIILDLNGTLCLSQHRPYPGFVCSAKARTKYIYIRPGLLDFLQFLFTHFRVAVWSSNSLQNAQATVEILFTREQQRLLQFVWGRNMCIAKNYGDYSSVKPLEKIEKQRGESLTNVTIIDDTPEKISGHCTDRNYYAIKPYEAPDASDTGLFEAREWLIMQYGIIRASGN